jgi:hypothetical protein
MAASEASFMLLIWLNENVDFRAIGRAPKRATVVSQTWQIAKLPQN